MSPIWKLLRSKFQTDEWHAGHRAALKSAFANRQWSQTRCFGAGFVNHGKCLLCLDDIVKRRLPHLTDEQRELSEPNADDIAAAGADDVAMSVAAVAQEELELELQMSPLGHHEGKRLNADDAGAEPVGGCVCINTPLSASSPSQPASSASPFIGTAVGTQAGWETCTAFANTHANNFPRVGICQEFPAMLNISDLSKCPAVTS